MSPDAHDGVRDLVGLYVLGALTPAESAMLEGHVAMCAACAAEVCILGPAVELLAQSLEPVDPSPRVRERLLRTISTRRALAGVPWLAAAALLAIAIGLGAYSAHLRDRVPSLRRQAAVLAATDAVMIELKGQPAAPGASARAFWSRSSGLVVAASALPPSPDGRTYQLWILTAVTPPISEGWLLRPDALGRVIATFDTPAALPSPVGVAVTMEPEGGTTAPTGAKYLVGAPD